ncbi:hypothetical protein [Virgibacillus pantothenticus]|uniref:hypothetical protein n=1 Tax=Virgibacillus pantothenticus TaxID=1473 RepID=UPI0025B067F9|nr:hypothetical protein [Virgibacillus pantothenticus]
MKSPSWAMEPDVAIRLFRYPQAPHIIGSYTRTKAQAPVQQRSEWNESTKDLGIMPIKLGYADVGRQARF